MLLETIFRILGSEIMQPSEAQLAAAVSAAKAKQALPQTEQDGVLGSVFNAEQIELLDRWIATNDPAIDRSEAIRRLVQLGLKVQK
jgi:hypothetical protein